MPTPSKGDRKPITVRVPDSVKKELQSRCSAAGVSSVSQYVADLLAASTGHEHLVRELTREQGVLPLSA